MDDFLDNVYKEVVQLDKNLENIKHFLTFVDTEDYKKDLPLQKILSFVQYTSISELILTLDRLFEPPSDGRDPNPILCDKCGNEVRPKAKKRVFGERSFIWYLEELKMHHTSFDAPFKFTNNELDEQLSWIKAEEEKFNVIGKYRDKWFAHRDKRYFDKPMKLWDDEPLELEVLEVTVNLAKRIVETHFSKLTERVLVWNPHNSEVQEIVSMRKSQLKVFQDF